MKRIKHNDLTHYFLREHSTLPPAYLASCEKFFKEISCKQPAASCQPDGWPSTKHQAPSTKLQAAGNRPECFSTKKHLTSK